MDKEDLNLNELLEDIRKIKNAINQNSYLFKKILDFPFLKLTLVLTGLMTFFVPIFYYFLLKQYINYEAIPFELRLALILAIIIGLSLLSFAKLSFYFQARQLTPRSSLIEIFSRMISRQVLVIYPLIIGSVIFFAVFFLAEQSYHLLVPTLAIGMGICFSVIGSFISLPEFFIFGNYFWISGMISVPFIIKAPLTSLLWISGIFGLGMLFFGFYLFFDRLRKEH